MINLLLVIKRDTLADLLRELAYEIRTLGVNNIIVSHSVCQATRILRDKPVIEFIATIIYYEKK